MKYGIYKMVGRAIQLNTPGNITYVASLVQHVSHAVLKSLHYLVMHTVLILARV